MLLAVFGTAADGQRLRGTVRDARGAQPLSAAVVSLLDGAGQSLARTVTDRDGAFILPVPDGAASVLVRRIGFRPWTAVLPDSARTGTAAIAAVLEVLPVVLEPIVARGTACAADRTEGHALALLEEAQAALLSMVVAREAIEADIYLLRAWRAIQRNTTQATSMRIDIGSVLSTKSFVAARPASEFAERGYVVRMPNGSRVYEAPDGEVLLDPSFRATHCFSLATANPAKPEQVGIAFKPTSDRVVPDIEGVIWLDRSPLALRSLVFSYVGLEPSIRQYGGGGVVSFRTAENGVVFIDEWTIRMVDPVAAALRSANPVQEIHSVVSSAVWGDGTRFGRVFSSVSGSVTEGRTRTPAAGVGVGLAGTPYVTRTREDGSFEIENVYPGPHRVVVVEGNHDFGISRAPATAVQVDPSRPAKVDISLAPLLPTARARCGRTRFGNGEGVVLARMVDTTGIVIPGQARVSVLHQAPKDTVIHSPGSMPGRIALCGVSAGLVTIAAETVASAGSANLRVSGGPVVDTVTVVLRPR